MTILSDQELDEKISNFMESKMVIFPELRHQPEIRIKEVAESRTMLQRIRDMVFPPQSARL